MAEIPSAVKPIRDQFESMVGKMTIELEVKKALDGLKTPVVASGQDQVAALNNEDMTRGPSGMGLNA